MRISQFQIWKLELFENKNYAPSCHSHHLSNDELLFINKTTTSGHYSIPSPLLFNFIAFASRSISSSLFLRYTIPSHCNSISFAFSIELLFKRIFVWCFVSVPTNWLKWSFINWANYLYFRISIEILRIRRIPMKWTNICTNCNKTLDIIIET